MFNSNSEEKNISHLFHSNWNTENIKVLFNNCLNCICIRMIIDFKCLMLYIIEMSYLYFLLYQKCLSLHKIYRTSNDLWLYQFYFRSFVLCYLFQSLIGEGKENNELNKSHKYLKLQIMRTSLSTFLSCLCV